MMDFHLYLDTLVMLIPIFTAGVCTILTAFSRGNCLTRQEKTLKNILILHLSLTFIVWLSIFSYNFFPEAFVFISIPCMAASIFVPIFFYRIIRFLTRLEQSERFSLWHYLAPALIGAVFIICSLIVPFDVQAEIFRRQVLALPGEYEVYSRIITSKPLLRMAFILVYYCFIARLLIRYYRRANGADAPVRKPARWIMFLIIISVPFVVSSITVSILPRNGMVASAWTTSASFNISLQMIVLTFHIIRRRYLPYAVHTEEPEEEIQTKKENEKKAKRKPHSNRLTRRKLNGYFREQKPYLKGDFKLTDAAEAMGVTRSIMSAFINKSYGVNFNRLVNQWRLKELERLRAKASNRGKSIAQLFDSAGFTEERQYYRAVAAERDGDETEQTESKSE